MSNERLGTLRTDGLMRLGARIGYEIGLVGLLLVAAARGQAQTTGNGDEWNVGADVGVDLARGNSHLTLLSLALEVTRLETRSFELNWSARALYGENADSVVARRYRTGLTFDWAPDATLSPFVFADAERDKFRKLEIRTNLGAGAKYVWWRSDRTMGSISAALLHDYQRFTSALPITGRAQNYARWSIRGRMNSDLRQGLRIEHVTFVKPAVKAIADYDVDSTTKGSLKLTDRVAVTLTWMLRYDSTPPVDVRRADHTVQFGLQFDF